MTEIKNIIFDLGVVLIDLTRENCIESFKKLGVNNIDKMTSIAIHNGVFGEFELGNISETDFYNEVRKLTHLPISDIQIKEAWLNMISDIPDYKLDAIIELKKKYNVLLLSNTNEIHWRHCEEIVFKKKGLCVSDYFDSIWLSCRMHKLKPDTEIFIQLTEAANIKPEETLFIDDAEANCKTAFNLGFKTYKPIANEDWRHLFK